MNSQENIPLEIEEPVSVEISPRKTGVYSWCRRILNFNDVPNQKHYCPIFILVMTILHVVIHLLTYIKLTWNGESFKQILSHLCMFFVPCMRPTSSDIRVRTFSCGSRMRNITCSYDDELKKTCFSFLYPHQLWRTITVNLLHLNELHLIANCLYQCLYGILLERKYGSARIFVIYWLSDLGASLSFALTDAEKSGVGASGALYGLLLFLIVDRLVAMQTNPGRRLFILMQLFLVVLLPFLITKPIILIFKFRIAHSAHFGGGLVGFLCSVCILGCPWPWNPERCISRMACQRIAFVLLLLYFLITTTIFFLRDAPVDNSILYKLELDDIITA